VQLTYCIYVTYILTVLLFFVGNCILCIENYYFFLYQGLIVYISCSYVQFRYICVDKSPHHNFKLQMQMYNIFGYDIFPTSM